MRVEPTLEAFARLVAGAAAAARLRGLDPGGTVREPALGGPRIRALARRAEAVAGPALNAGLPLRGPARLEVGLADGSVPSRVPA